MLMQCSRAETTLQGGCMEPVVPQGAREQGAGGGKGSGHTWQGSARLTAWALRRCPAEQRTLVEDIQNGARGKSTQACDKQPATGGLSVVIAWSLAVTDLDALRNLAAKYNRLDKQQYIPVGQLWHHGMVCRHCVVGRCCEPLVAAPLVESHLERDTRTHACMAA